MLTLIEPEDILMDCIGPKLQGKNHEYVILELDKFCQERSLEFGHEIALSSPPQLNRYWLGLPTHSLSKDLLQSFCDVDDHAIWINDPIRSWQTHYFGYQLKMAELSGFQIRPTIITQNLARLSEFKDKHEDKVVKVAQPDSHPTVYIYREAISRAEQIRIYVFGGKTRAFNLGSFSETQKTTVSRSRRFWSLQSDFAKSVERFMRLSRLEFGIIDLALVESGEMYWTGFSTDTTLLALDDKLLPSADLCTVLAEFLISSPQ